MYQKEQNELGACNRLHFRSAWSGPGNGELEAAKPEPKLKGKK